MRNDALIFAGPAVQRAKACPEGTTPSPSKKNPEATAQKGDLLIRNLLQNGTYIVHDMRVVNTDDKSYLEKTPEKFLQEAEGVNKKIYLEAYLHQRRHCSPFVASVDGLLDVEAAATLIRIASRFAKK